MNWDIYDSAVKEEEGKYFGSITDVTQDHKDTCHISLRITTQPNCSSLVSSPLFDSGQFSELLGHQSVDVCTVLFRKWIESDQIQVINLDRELFNVFSQ